MPGPQDPQTIAHPISTHAPRASSRKSVWVAFILISGYMLAEVLGGLAANSLALLADAGHMLTDALALLLALLALWVAARPASAKRTFGFQRTEVLAAALNAVSLWLIAGWIFVQAYQRFQDPPEVRGPIALVVGSVGLLVNLGAAWILRRSARHSLNVEGAFLHVLGDLLGSVAVVAASVLIMSFGWFVVDPIFGVFIGVLILVTSGRLLWKLLHVLMEGTPAGMDIRRLCQRLEQVPGVTGVHDIHAWSVTSGYNILSAHVTVDETGVDEQRRLLQVLRDIASKEFDMTHVTIQFEESETVCGEGHHITHDQVRV